MNNNGTPTRRDRQGQVQGSGRDNRPRGAWRGDYRGGRGGYRGGKSREAASDGHHNQVNKKASSLHDRMAWLTGLMIGQLVELTTRSGTTYVGLLFTVKPIEGGNAYVLKMARTKGAEMAEVQTPPIETLVVFPNEFLQIVVRDMRCSNEHMTAREQRGFMTDGDISGKTEIAGRDLVAWRPPENGADSFNSFQDLESSTTGKWNQFSANKKLFGVKSTFQEEFYTTPLDKSSNEYLSKAGEADRIAREIMAEQSGNIHLQEERGHKLETDLDEEDLYSGVLREDAADNKVSLQDAPKAIAQMLQNAKNSNKEAAAMSLGEMSKTDLKKKTTQPDKKDTDSDGLTEKEREDKRKAAMRADAEDFNPFEFGEVMESLPTSHVPVLQHPPAEVGQDAFYHQPDPYVAQGMMAYANPQMYAAAPGYMRGGGYPPPQMPQYGYPMGYPQGYSGGPAAVAPRTPPAAGYPAQYPSPGSPSIPYPYGQFPRGYPAANLPSQGNASPSPTPTSSATSTPASTPKKPSET